MRGAQRLVAVIVAGGLSSCAPTLDWREFSPDGSGITVTFPCRPDRHARTVQMAASRGTLQLLTCDAGGATYAVGFFDVADPRQVEAVLAAWRASALANVQAVASRIVPLSVKGMTANPQAVSVFASGHLPDGDAVVEHAAFFVHGLRAYQAAVIGAAPSDEAAATFFSGLRFPD